MAHKKKQSRAFNSNSGEKDRARSREIVEFCEREYFRTRTANEREYEKHFRRCKNNSELLDCYRRHYRGPLGNPLYAWDAFAECRSAGLDIPAWVLEYFEEVARTISAVARSREFQKNYERKVAEAFGFKEPGKKGRGNIVRQLFDESKDIHLAFKVYEYLIIGDQLSYAYEFAARDTKSSKSEALRAWKTYQHLFPLK